MKLFFVPASIARKVNWKVAIVMLGLLLSTNLAACSDRSTTPDAGKGDAMKGDAMKGMAMKGDAMKGDAIKVMR